MVSRSPASVRSSPSVRAARADLHVGLLSRGGRGPYYVETERRNRYEHIEYASYESFLHKKRQGFRIYSGMVREAY